MPPTINQVLDQYDGIKEEKEPSELQSNVPSSSRARRAAVGASLPHIPERQEHIHSADPNLSKSKMVSALDQQRGIVRNVAKGYGRNDNNPRVGLPPKHSNRSNYEIRQQAMVARQHHIDKENNHKV